MLPALSKLQELSTTDMDSLWRSHLGGTLPGRLPRFLLPNSSHTGFKSNNTED